MDGLACRNPETQLALLDRLAGTDAAVAQYAEKLEQLRGAHAQLAAIDALGSEEQRQRLQDLVNQVITPEAPAAALNFAGPPKQSEYLADRSMGFASAVVCKQRAELGEDASVYLDEVGRGRDCKAFSATLGRAGEGSRGGARGGSCVAGAAAAHGGAAVQRAALRAGGRRAEQPAGGRACCADAAECCAG